MKEIKILKELKHGVIINYITSEYILFEWTFWFAGSGSETRFGFDLQYADYKSYRKKNENAIPLHGYDAWKSTQSIQRVIRQPQN